MKKTTKPTPRTKLYPHTTDGGAQYLMDAFVKCPNGHNETFAANARLIAAAPAMLEALRAVAALANGQGRANLMEISGQAQQIIAQAEGGAQ